MSEVSQAYGERRIFGKGRNMRVRPPRCVITRGGREAGALGGRQIRTLNNTTFAPRSRALKSIKGPVRQLTFTKK